MRAVDLTSRVERISRLTERRVGEARAVSQDLKAAKAEIAELEGRIQACEEVIGILNTFADERQAEVQRRVEGLVTLGLRTIFGPDMSFHVVAGTKGKLAVAEFVVRSKMGDQVVETPVMDARGGGVAAVTGFLLRLILLLLRRDARATLFLDETFAQLSAEYEPRLADFIRELVDRTGVQVVMVTHSEAYAEGADRTYRLRLEDGRTSITEA